MKWLDKVRPNIMSLIPYSSARGEFKGKASVFIDANENPYDAEFPYNRYPDPLQSDLKNLIADWRNVKVDQIFLGNGSDEIIDILIRVFCIPGRDAIYTFKPGFGMYKVAATINDISISEFPLDTTFQLDVDSFLANMPVNNKITFLCSPNNPTGNSINLSKVKFLCEKTDSIIVVDEAYIDFSEKSSAISLLSDYPNLVVLQTFSKALGGAGIRTGMAFAHPELVNIMNKVKMPYNISRSNQMEAIRLVKDIKKLEEIVEQVKIEKSKLKNALSGLNNVIEVYPSDANFFLVKFDNANAVYDSLIREGIVVRSRTNQYNCAGCLRISVGTPAENQKLMETLTKINQ